MRWFSRRTPSDSQRFAFPRTTLAAFKPPRTIISAPLPSNLARDVPDVPAPRDGAQEGHLCEHREP
jgi:hypothetical protein